MPDGATEFDDWLRLFDSEPVAHVAETNDFSLARVLEVHCDVQGYPHVPREVWLEVRKRYSYSEIQKGLARHFVSRKVPFPLPPIERREAKRDFVDLCGRDWATFIGPTVESAAKNPSPDTVPREYRAKYAYRHWTPETVLGHVSRNTLGGKASNYFHRDTRLRTGGWKDPGALSCWENEDLLAKVRWPSKVMRDGPTRDVWRKTITFANGLYVPSTFRPSVAKCFYGWLGGVQDGAILDPSCGWGDRLAGFYATPSARVYAGCDPNTDVWKAYRDQCVAYEEWLAPPDTTKWIYEVAPPALEDLTISGYPAFRCHGSKDVLIVNGPFEDIDWSEIASLVAPNGFDLAFTSPPYFGVERYGEGSSSAGNQSWSRYTTGNAWLTSFLLPVWRHASKVLKDGGFLGVNIADPGVDDQRQEVCDPLVEDLLTVPEMSYEGVVAMSMSKRPSSGEILGDMDPTSFAEPVWIFRKRDRGVPSFLPRDSGKENDTIFDDEV